MKILKHKDTQINFGSKGQFFLSTEKCDMQDYVFGYVNTNIAFDADYEAGHEERFIMPTKNLIIFKDMETANGKAKVRYNINTHPVTLIEEVTPVDGLNVITQKTSVSNDGEEDAFISRLSCANVTGIGLGGSKWYENDQRFIVHICHNHWQGEAQWRKYTLSELGLYPASGHNWERCFFRIQSVGSWSTSEYYPLMIIEDTERGECWFFEREGAENWYMEINAYEGFNGEFFNVAIGGADENCGWTYTLKPGETYTTTTAVYGVVKGGFEEAVRELTAYKRRTSLVHTDIEVAFNDFMNCYWAQPSADRLIPLIDRAAELGVQTFCIDDGWSNTGEWDPLEDKFGTYGLKGIIEYIRSKGMRAGVWFEFETTTYNIARQLGDDILLYRDKKLIAKHRPKLDLRNNKAREWLLGKIDYVYKMGVRYIKNDHNNDEKWGTNYDGESPAEGLRRKEQAFYDFVEELHVRYPDLVIENCGAGAMRQDHGTLKHFSLQSTSDQEDYRLYPSILVGAMACLPPEKAGIWGYPYPLLYKNIGTMSIPEEELLLFKDGRETVFNMVSAMCGYMYLSGRLDLADGFNTQLIKEAIEIYKGYKDTISCRYPAFILPMKPMADKTYNSFGLIDADNKDMILAVWALEQTEFTLDLSKYAFAKAEKLYPLSLSNAQINYSRGLIDCRFNERYSAILIKLS